MGRADRDISVHSEQVAELAPRVGRVLGMAGPQLVELELAAQFHDIGKVSVPGEILRKPGPLDELEREVMARHVEWGAELLRQLPHCEPIAEIVRHHHERFDGAGYPDGLEGCEIPLPSRIIAACDAYGAMLSDRPYRSALGRDGAMLELADNAGTQFDPDAVAALLEVTGARSESAAL